MPPPGFLLTASENVVGCGHDWLRGLSKQNNLTGFWLLLIAQRPFWTGSRSARMEYEMDRKDMRVGMDVTFYPHVFRTPPKIRMRGEITCIPADDDDPIEILLPGGPHAYRYPIDIELPGTAVKKDAGT